MPAFLPGVELARAFYTDAVRPLLGDRPHIAARLGAGSDVLGYDSARSTDHDWGPRLELFVADPGDLDHRLRHQLPKRFRGWSTHFVPPGARVRSMADTDGPVDHYVTITELGTWLHDHLGYDPRAPIGTTDWLATPWQRLAEITGGAVFHDPGGELTTARERLSWYPDDLWRHVLASQWTRISQEEAFVGRTAEAGDVLGSRIVTARLCRDLARLLLLLERRWPPYQKWLFTAISGHPAATLLSAAVHSTSLRRREAALCAAYEHAAHRQNELGLAGTVDATRRPFFDRGYLVIGAERFAAELHAAITDPDLAGRPLIGSVDQISDNAGVLTDPALCRRIVG